MLNSQQQPYIIMRQIYDHFSPVTCRKYALYYLYIFRHDLHEHRDMVDA